MPVGNPLIDPGVASNKLGTEATGTAHWKTADVAQLLRGIYVELRVMNLLLANGLSNEPYLQSIRRDPTSVYPDAQDGD